MACQHEKNEEILNSQGFVVSRCLKCDLVWSSKIGSRENRELYDQFYGEGTADRFNPAVELIVKAFRFWRALKIFLLKPGAKSVLDIGSGRGWTLFFLKKYFGYKSAVGTQISRSAYIFSKERLGLEVYDVDLLEKDFQRKFDTISIFHVLEHVESPQEYLAKISQLAKIGGILLVEVPNYNAWTRRISFRHWLALDLEHHLTFFTPAVLRTMLEENGFEARKIRTFSMEYSAFTSTQSILNMATGSQDVFFKWLAGKKTGIGAGIILHLLLFAILFIPCLLVNLFLLFSQSGEVISITAKKNGF